MSMADDVRREVGRILNDIRTVPLRLHVGRCFECGQEIGHSVLEPPYGPDDALCRVCRKPRLLSCPRCSWTTGEILRVIGDEDTAMVHRIALDNHIRTRHDQHHMDPEQFVPVEHVTGADLSRLFGIELIEDDTVPDDEIQLRSEGRVVGRITLDPS